MWFIYLLLCKDKSIYIGATNDWKQRFLLHRQGKGGRYTRSHGAIRILYSEQFKTRSKALKREAEIKRWRRKRKLDLVKLGKA